MILFLLTNPCWYPQFIQNLRKELQVPPLKEKQNPKAYYQKHRYYLVSSGSTLFPCICPIKWDKSFASPFSDELPSSTLDFIAGSCAQVEQPYLLGMWVLCHCKRLQWAVAVTGLILACPSEAFKQRWDNRENHNVHFLKPFFEACYLGNKKYWLVCVCASKFSETLTLFIFDWARNERTTGTIASVQGADLKGWAKTKCSLQIHKDLPPPVSSVDKIRMEIIS